MTPPPRCLEQIKAELLFIDDTYLLHYLEQGKHHYKCLAPDTLRLAFNNQPFDSDWLPSGLVRHGSNCRGEWGILFIPPKQHYLRFSDYQLQIFLPSLVFMGYYQSYWLWAIKEPLFSPQAKVFHAPLPNVNLEPSGMICWGDQTPPIVNLTTLKKAWKLFINSQFSPHYTASKSCQFPHNIIDQLQQIAQEQQESKGQFYPVSDLLPIGHSHQTIAQLVGTVLSNYESS